MHDQNHLLHLLTWDPSTYSAIHTVKLSLWGLYSKRTKLFSVFQPFWHFKYIKIKLHQQKIPFNLRSLSLCHHLTMSTMENYWALKTTLAKNANSFYFSTHQLHMFSSYKIAHLSIKFVKLMGPSVGKIPCAFDQFNNIIRRFLLLLKWILPLPVPTPPRISVTPLDHDTHSKWASSSLSQPTEYYLKEGGLLLTISGRRGLWRSLGGREGVRKHTGEDSTWTNLKGREKDYRPFSIVWVEKQLNYITWFVSPGQILHGGEFSLQE